MIRSQKLLQNTSTIDIEVSNKCCWENLRNTRSCHGTEEFTQLQLFSQTAFLHLSTNHFVSVVCKDKIFVYCKQFLTYFLQTGFYFTLLANTGGQTASSIIDRNFKERWKLSRVTKKGQIYIYWTKFKISLFVIQLSKIFKLAFNKPFIISKMSWFYFLYEICGWLF